MPENDRGSERLKLLAEVDDLMRTIAEWEHDMADLMPAVEAFEVMRLHYLAGPDYDAMHSGRDALRAFLDHAKPARRCAALNVIRRTREFSLVERVLRICRSDPNVTVRGHAIATATSLYSGLRDRRSAATLASIVSDANDADAVRAKAYHGLLIIAGQFVPVSLFERGWVPSEVNWDLVAAFTADDASRKREA